MPIYLAHRRTQRESLKRRYKEPIILDVTSKGPLPWVKFSPFYPHGNIPIPLSPGHVGASVEGIWQGLKVFENADVEPTKWTVTNMRGIKRSVRGFGRIRGHRAGVGSELLLDYRDARKRIYLPCYKWVLDHRLQKEVEALRRKAAVQNVVLLDYNTNCDAEDLSRPLSHAGLVKAYIEEGWSDG